MRRLETQGVGDTPYVDPEDAAIALFRWFEVNIAAVAAGKARDIPVYGPHPEPSPAKVRLCDFLMA